MLFDNVVDTIIKPWREPVSLSDLVLYGILYVIIAFVVSDMLRVIASYIAASAKEVIKG
jgi:hypothetical protein